MRPGTIRCSPFHMVRGPRPQSGTSPRRIRGRRFRKGQAKKYRTPYQAMVRRLLDHYVQYHSTPAPR
jgi:hypothetical protein